MDPKDFWHCAATFEDKSIYKDHARLQQFERAKGRKVLEYGCGGGSDTVSYLKAGAFVWFADIVDGNVIATVDRIQRSPVPQDHAVGLFLKKSDEIPQVSGIEIVSSHGVLHHIENPLPVLKEFARVMRPGGLLYVMLYTEELWDSFLPRIKELVAEHSISLEEAFGWCTDGKGCPYARAYTEQEGTAMLKLAGFEMVHAEAWAPQPHDRKFFRTFKARLVK